MRSLLILGAGTLVLALLFGCGGKQHATSSPTLPGSPLPGGSLTDSGGRQSSNVTEGEVIVSGGGANPASEFVEIPIPAQQVAIVQLEAEGLTSGDVSLPALAHLSHDMGAYSLAPAVSGRSTYGVPRTGTAQTFVRRFNTDGILKLELSGLLGEPGQEVPGDVRWRYRITHADPPPPGERNREHPHKPRILEVRDLPLDTPTRGTLIRGDGTGRWHMQQRFRVHLVRGSTYRVEFRPELAPAGWTWHAQLEYGQVRRWGYPLLADDPAEPRWFEFPGDGSTRNLMLAVWADVPEGEVAQPEAASFEVRIIQSSPTVPKIRLVAPLKADRSYFEVFPPNTNSEVIPEIEEHQDFRLFIASSAHYSQREMPDDHTPRYGPSLLVGEAGDYEIPIRVSNDAGTSELFNFRFRSLPAKPSIHRIIRPEDPQVGEPVQFRAEASYRVTSYAWDFGPHAIPQFSIDAEPWVIFHEHAQQRVTLRVENESGNDSRETHVSFDSELDLWSPLARWKAGNSGDTMTFYGFTEESNSGLLPDEHRWTFFSSGLSSTASGNVATIPLGEPGIHHFSLRNYLDGAPGTAQDFRYIVNPAGTSLRRPTDIGDFTWSSGRITTERLNGDALMVRDNGRSVFTKQIEWDIPIGSDSNAPEFAPYIRTYSSATGYTSPTSGSEVIDDTLYVATFDASLAPALWRVDAGAVTQIPLPPFTGIDATPVTKSIFIDLLACEGRLVLLHAAERGSHQNARLAVITIPVGPAAGQAPAIIRTFQFPWTADYLRALGALPQGIVGSLGEGYDYSLFRIPIAAGVPTGFERVADSGISIYRDTFLGGDSAWFIARGMPGTGQRLALVNTSWETFLTPEDWHIRELPLSLKVTETGVIATAGGVHVLTKSEEFPDRLIELVPDPSGTGWQVLDRIDAWGTARLDTWGITPGRYAMLVSPVQDDPFAPELDLDSGLVDLW